MYFTLESAGVQNKSYKSCVEAFRDGREAYSSDSWGLSRYRAIAADILLTIILSLLFATDYPHWWPTEWVFDIARLAIIIAVGGIVGLGLAYLRWRTRRSLEMKYCLHKIAEYARDHYATLQQSLSGTEPNCDLSHTSEKICSLLQDYYDCLIPRGKVKVAIRIAMINSRTGAKEYRTIARSNRFNTSRSDTSESVPADKGIARFLQDNEFRGIAVYNDLEEAAQMGAYFPTENDRRHKKDVCTMMVAPLNGWDGEKTAMLGILFVASPKKNVFAEKHTDAMGFTSDAVANIYATTIRELGKLN